MELIVIFRRNFLGFEINSLKTFSSITEINEGIQNLSCQQPESSLEIEEFLEHAELYFRTLMMTKKTHFKDENQFKRVKKKALEKLLNISRKYKHNQNFSCFNFYSKILEALN